MQAIQILRTLLIAIAGGSLATVSGFPGGWLTGSLTAIAVSSLAGFEARMPGPLKVAGFVIVGLVAGSSVRPDTLAQIWTWPLSFVVLAASLTVSVPAAIFYLRRLAGWDAMTAFLAAFPGALSVVIATSEDVGADTRRIVISQTLRVMMLLLIVPLALPWIGGVPDSMAVIPDETVKAGQLAILMAVSLLCGYLAQKVGIPGGLVVGSMVAAAILFASGLIDTHVPAALFAIGLVIVGVITGGRFRPGDIRLIRAVLPHAAAVFVLLVTTAILAAALTGAMLGIALPQILMAYAPGALEAMVALAVITGVDAAFVAAHHAVRFFAISILVPIIAARQRSRSGSTA